jgi:hypothetical protein
VLYYRAFAQPHPLMPGNFEMDSSALTEETDHWKQSLLLASIATKCFETALSEMSRSPSSFVTG